MTEKKDQSSIRPCVTSGERPLNVFISSVMRTELEWARNETVNTLDHAPYLSRWAFEFTPGSSERVDDSYLRHVREADIVIWLVSEDATIPVCNEIREALASNRRLWVVKLPGHQLNAGRGFERQCYRGRAGWSLLQNY